MEKQLLIVHLKDINKTRSCVNPFPVCKKHKRKVKIKLMKVLQNLIGSYPHLLTSRYNFTIIFIIKLNFIHPTQ